MMGLQKIFKYGTSGIGWYAVRDMSVVVLTFNGWSGTTFTLPENWRPSQAAKCLLTQEGVAAPVRASISTDGSVFGYGIDTTKPVACYGQVVFVTP